MRSNCDEWVKSEVSPNKWANSDESDKAKTIVEEYYWYYFNDIAKH